MDERERQRRCRSKEKAAGCGPPGGDDGQKAGPPKAESGMALRGECHAPGSACIRSELQEKVLESWDRAVAMSRASLVRRIEGISRSLGLDFG